MPRAAGGGETVQQRHFNALPLSDQLAAGVLSK